MIGYPNAPAHGRGFWAPVPPAIAQRNTNRANGPRLNSSNGTFNIVLVRGFGRLSTGAASWQKLPPNTRPGSRNSSPVCPIHAAGTRSRHFSQTIAPQCLASTTRRRLQDRWAGVRVPVARFIGPHHALDTGKRALGLAFRKLTARRRLAGGGDYFSHQATVYA